MLKDNIQFKQEVRLSSVSFKMNRAHRICGLQFHFNNNISSAKFEVGKAGTGRPWQTAELDPHDKIASVEIYVNSDTGKYAIQALRFRDKNDVSMQCITEEKPKNNIYDGKWVK